MKIRAYLIIAGMIFAAFFSGNCRTEIPQEHIPEILLLGVSLNNATLLQELSVSSGSLSPAFDPGTTNYNVDLAISDESISVIPVVRNPGDTITINGQVTGSGVSSPETNLGLGGNTIEVTVTSAFGLISKTYTITANRYIRAQQAYVKGAAADELAHFGNAVAIDGDTMVVGAFSDSRDSSGITSGSGISGTTFNGDFYENGAAYVFVRDSKGNWAQQAYLKASSPHHSAWFGYSVAISGDRIIVGSSNESSGANVEDDGVNNSGAAYVFTRDADGIWSEEIMLKASDITVDDQFGLSVSISGDTIVVGSYNDEAETGDDEGLIYTYGSGKVYVFALDAGGTWTEQDIFTQPSPYEDDNDFGQTVSISDDIIVVGAAWAGEDGQGEAYVYKRAPNGTWSQEFILTASNAAAYAHFGNSVSISGDTIIIGAYEESSDADGVKNGANSSGAAYVFKRAADGTWSQEAYLKASNAASADRFGCSVAISGDTVIVGSKFEDSEQDNSGAAYVFVRNDAGTWSPESFLKAANPGKDDFFGYFVAVSGDTIIAGAPYEDGNYTGVLNGSGSDGTDDVQHDDSGAVYVYY